MESEKFAFSDVVWDYQEVTQFGKKETRRVAMDIRGVTATCKSCDHSWQASKHGEGLKTALGGVIVTCPSCGAEEKVNGTVFGQNS